MTTPGEPNPHKRKLVELTLAQKREDANAAFKKLNSEVSRVYWTPAEEAHESKVPFVRASISTYAAYLRQFYEDFAHKEAILKGTAPEALPPVFQLPPPAPMAPQPMAPQPVCLQVLSYDHKDWSKNIAYHTQTTIELDSRPVVFCRVPGKDPSVQYVTSATVQPPVLRSNITRAAHCTVRAVDGGKVQVEGGVYALATGTPAGTTPDPVPYWVDGVMVTGTRLLSQGQTVEFQGRLVNPAKPSEVLKQDLVVMSFKVV